MGAHGTKREYNTGQGTELGTAKRESSIGVGGSQEPGERAETKNSTRTRKGSSSMSVKSAAQ